MNKNTKKTNNIRISGADRLAQLLVMNEALFTVKDLATLWKIKNPHTLRVLLARYVKKGLLYRVWRGLYSTINPRDINPLVLGIKVLHRYSYASCETILFKHGSINQRPTEITLVSSISKRFSLLGHHYHSRKLPDKLLYDNSGVLMEEGVRIASLDRAKRDMAYFNPKKYYDANK